MLVLVLGPSGAGKDTLLDAARDALAHEPRFHFVQRVITRPPGLAGEVYESVSDQEFELRRASGGLALTWRAHGLLYGIPSDISLHLAQGRVCIANVSRAVVAEAAERFPVSVIEVTAPADVLARRLAARGRENAVDVARRLARSIELPLPVQRERVENDGTVEQGSRRFLAAVRKLAAEA